MRVGLPVPVSLCRDHVTLFPHANEIKTDRLINLCTLKRVALKLREIGMFFDSPSNFTGQRHSKVRDLRLRQRCR
jgi:hypothetical protein